MKTKGEIVIEYFSRKWQYKGLQILSKITPYMFWENLRRCNSKVFAGKGLAYFDFGEQKERLINKSVQSYNGVDYVISTSNLSEFCSNHVKVFLNSRDVFIFFISG